MKYYLLDTSVYGVLPDPKERDYKIVKNIMEYAKENRENFVTTFIISKELASDKVSEDIKETILPVYYSAVSSNRAPLEIMHSDRYSFIKKLAWNYIQKLEEKKARKVMDDALNYALASVAGVDAFVTRNRRGILADPYHKILEKCNEKFRLKFVKILRPNQFYESFLF